MPTINGTPSGTGYDSFTGLGSGLLNRLGNTPLLSAEEDARRRGLAEGTYAGTKAKTAGDIATPGMSAALSGLMASLGSAPPHAGGNTGTSGVPAQVQMPTSVASMAPAPAPVTFGGSGSAAAAPAAVGHVAGIDTSAAESASFARAKDQVGATSQGALAGLRSALGGRGMLGSGSESRGAANVINAGQGQLGDVSRQQAITRAELAQKNADTNYAGDISQREQDLGFASSNADRASAESKTAYEGAIGQRGQDISRETAANSLAGEDRRASYSGAIDQRGQDISATKAANDTAMQAYLAQMSQRGDILKGLLSAMSGGSY